MQYEIPNTMQGPLLGVNKYKCIKKSSVSNDSEGEKVGWDSQSQHELSQPEYAQFNVNTGYLCQGLSNKHLKY